MVIRGFFDRFPNNIDHTELSDIIATEYRFFCLMNRGTFLVWWYGQDGGGTIYRHIVDFLALTTAKTRTAFQFILCNVHLPIVLRSIGPVQSFQIVEFHLLMPCYLRSWSVLIEQAVKYVAARVGRQRMFLVASLAQPDLSRAVSVTPY